MPSRFPRIVLIISLLISMFMISGVVLTNEAFAYESPISQLSATMVLFLVQVILLITIYVTKKSQILLIVCVINAVLAFILFIWKFHKLEDLLFDYKNRFHELMLTFPHGEKPDISHWGLRVPHSLIFERKCCIEDLLVLPTSFYGNVFHQNCQLPMHFNFDRHQFTNGAPCLNFAHMAQELMKANLITALIEFIIVLIVYGIYIYLCRRDEQTNGMPGTTYPVIIDPSIPPTNENH